MDKGRPVPDFSRAAARVEAVIRRSEAISWNRLVLQAIETGGRRETVPCILGVDTNVILELAANSSMLEGLQKWLAISPDVILVVPLQAFQESWNNVENISSKRKTPASKLKEALKVAQEGGYPPHCVGVIEEAVEAVEKHDADLVEIGVAIEGMTDALTTLLAPGRSIASAYPRFDDRGMYDIRLSSKTPPGFEDAKAKGGQHYGDFSLWLDFLTGVAYALDEFDVKEGDILFLTNEKKADWLVAGRSAHPSLTLEMLALTGRSLRILDYSGFKKAIIDPVLGAA